MRRSGRVLLGVLLGIAVVVTALQSSSVYAAQIITRTLTLQQGATGDGGSKPSGVVNHVFTFTVPTAASIGSIRFQYCTTAAGNCTTPAGLSTTAATSGTQVGATGFTLNAATNGSPYFTRTAAAVAANTAITIPLNGVTNPSATNTSFFVRITTYTGTDGVTGPVDNGTVTASTATQIVLTGIMPESIIFCTGETVSMNCTSATAGNIAFNQLFSPSDTATATSQMAASTNAPTGYVITVNGPTMTSGSNTIPPMTTAGVGVKGTSQFGMNLRANTTTTSTVAVGADLTPASNGGGLKGQAFTGYNVADTFKYTSGDTVANSSSDGSPPPAVTNVPGTTNSQVYTASYIVNVAGNQLAGTYTTTLTYICTATF